MKIAISGAGSRLQLVRLARGSLNNAVIYCFDSDGNAPALKAGDKAITLVKASDPNFKYRVCEAIQKEQIDHWLTIIDVELCMLAELKKAGWGQLIVTENAGVCQDKWKMFRVLSDIGVNTPMASLAPFSHFPQVIKDRRGSAASGFAICYKEVDLRTMARLNSIRCADVIFQELVDGEHLDVDFYVDLLDRMVKSIVVRQVIKSRNGETYQALFIESSDALREIVCLIAERLRLVGPNNMDLIRGKNGLFVIDINPRFGANYPATHLVGHDYFRALHRNFLAEANKELGQYPVGLLMSKVFEIDVVGSSASTMATPPRPFWSIVAPPAPST